MAVDAFSLDGTQDSNILRFFGIYANHSLGGEVASVELRKPGKDGLKGAVQPTCREGKAVIL